jgi:hypothetical protein
MYLHLSAGVLRAICLFVVLVLAILGFRARRKVSSTSKRRRFRFTGVAVGNALQILHVYVDPRVRHVIVQRLDEQAEDDGEDDCPDPGKHVERQLRRIRRGEQIERLTIRMREKR